MAEPTPRKRSPLGVLFLTLFLDLVGFSIIFPLFPAMLEHYLPDSQDPSGLVGGLRSFLETLAGGADADHDHYTAVLFGGFLGSLYSALQFLCAPLWGRLSDRIGRRRVLIMSVTGIAVSYALWVVSGSFELLIVSRLLGGCMSGNISTASAAVADSTSRENRAKGMGIIGAAFGLGFICGPALGALAYFLAGGAESKLDILGTYPGLADFGVNPFSGPALVAFALAVANLIWVIGRFEETTTPEQREQARQARSPLHPLMLVGKVDVPNVTRANLAYFLFLVAFSGVEFTLTFFVSEAPFSYNVGQISTIFVFAGFIIALVQGGIVRRVAPKWGERNVAIAGLLTLAPGFFLIASSPPSQVQLYVGLAFMAVGSALTIPCLTSLVSLYTPMDRQGAVLGIFRSLGALSRAIGPIIFCSVYWKFGKTSPYISGAALLALPVLLALTLPQPRKDSATEAA